MYSFSTNDSVSRKDDSENPTNNMIEQIKAMRMQLHGLADLVKQLEKSRETSLAITKLEESKMWLGKVLKELGNINPYPESKNPASKEIEPTADTGKLEFPEEILKAASVKNVQIAMIKWLRAEIEKAENQLKGIYNIMINSFNEERWGVLHFIKSTEYCIEAGMWLGMTLSNHRTN